MGFEKRLKIYLLVFLCISINLFSQNQTHVNSQKFTNSLYSKDGIFSGFNPQDEIVSKRTKISKHFKIANGSTVVQFGGNYHYKDSSGKWRDINLSIVENKTIVGYDYVNLENDFKTYFPSANYRKGISVNHAEFSDFTFWKNPQLKIISSQNDVAKFISADLSNAKVQGTDLLYDEIYKGISEHLAMKRNGIKTNTIIKNLSDDFKNLGEQDSIVFEQFIPLGKDWKVFGDGKQFFSNFESTTISLQPSGSKTKINFGEILIFDDAVNFEFAQKMLLPSEQISSKEKRILAKHTTLSTYKVEFVGSELKVSIVVPASWLKNSVRKFPVTIDPLISFSSDDSISSYLTPLSHYYGYQKTANLYLNSELNIVGSITKLEFSKASSSGSGAVPTTVYLKSTPSTQLHSDAWNSNFYTGTEASLALNASVNLGSGSGWKSLQLTTPFVYDKDNLMVMIEDSYGGGGKANYYYTFSDFIGRQAAIRTNYSNSPSNAVVSVENFLPEIRITYDPIEVPNSSIIYVNKNVNGGLNNGTSWENAFSELADALKWSYLNKESLSQIEDVQIWVANGVYQPFYTTQLDLESNVQDRKNTFLLTPNIKLYGGFLGFETSIEERLLPVNGTVSGTILSGDFGLNDYFDEESNQFANTSENAYHLLSAFGTEQSNLFVIDGFQIVGGNANTDSVEFFEGTQTYTHSKGGAFYGYSASKPLNIQFSNVLFGGNFALNDGGVLYYNSEMFPSNVQFSNTVIKNNTSGKGGVVSVSSSVSALENGILSFEKSSLKSNENLEGSLILLNGNNVSFTSKNTKIEDSNSNIGTIYSNALGKSEVTFFNSLVVHNSSEIGSVLNVDALMPVLNFYNSTIVDNYGLNFINSENKDVDFTLRSYNSILHSNFQNDDSAENSQISANEEFSKDLQYSLIQNENDDSNGNIPSTQNPAFVNQNLRDYQLSTDSPARDSGNSTLLTTSIFSSDEDIIGNPRIQGCQIDMGAYEDLYFQPHVLWDGASWSKTEGPLSTDNACINSNYSIASGFTAKRLILNKGILTIQPNTTVIIEEGIDANEDHQIILKSDGSLIQKNDAAENSDKKITVERTVKMRKMDYTYWSSPLKNQKLINNLELNDGFSLGTPNNRIYDYNEPNDLFRATADTHFKIGKGYAIRGKEFYNEYSYSPDVYFFRGEVNNGFYEINLQKSKKTKIANVEYEHGYNLIGNPYPSNINFDELFALGNNSNVIDAKAWFWSNVTPQITMEGSSYNGNNYATYSLTGGVPPTAPVNAEHLIPTEQIKVGQGFIVFMKGETSLTSPTQYAKITMDNSIRSGDDGIFYNANKTATKDRFWLQQISPDQISNTLLIGYLQGATNSYDRNFDSELMIIGDDAFYSVLNGGKLQINGRAFPLNLEDRIPLGVKHSKEGYYKIRLLKKEGVFENTQDIYLKDKVQNTTHLISASDYTYYSTTGLDETRFEIVYKPDGFLSTSDNLNEKLKIYKTEKSFVVEHSKNVIDEVELYDISGKLLVKKNDSQTKIEIPYTLYPSSVYVLKIRSNGEISTRRVLK